MSKEIILTHYKLRDFDDIAMAESLVRINQLRKEIFGRMQNPLQYVIGASTSGARSPKKNKDRTTAVMSWLKTEGASAPNYYPFVKRLNQILRKDFKEKTLSKSQEYEVRMSILNDFHKPILAEYEGIVLRLMPDWESSDRCWQLREFAKDHGIIIKLITDVHVQMAEKLAEKLSATKTLTIR